MFYLKFKLLSLSLSSQFNFFLALKTDLDLISHPQWFLDVLFYDFSMINPNSFSDDLSHPRIIKRLGVLNPTTYARRDVRTKG
jgi:hypothetical protein